MLFKTSSYPISNNVFYTKENRNDLKNRVKLSDQDINQYYRPMIQLCMAYNESLYYFARADFHQDNSKQVLNRKDVLKKLTQIYLNHSNKSMILEEIGKNKSFIKKLSEHDFAHKELVKSLGAEKAAFKFYYAEYSKLQEALDKIYDKHHLDDILQILNNQLVEECSKKNLNDRSDYYLTFDDKQIYDYLVSPIVGFHAILISFVFLPASVARSVIFTGAALSTGIGISKNQVINFLKRTYNIIIRDHNYYNIENELLEEKIVEAHQQFDLYKLREIILKLKQSATKTGEYNYFIANTFKYYAKLKGDFCHKSKDYLVDKKTYGFSFFENKYLENDEDYKKFIYNRKYLYYKLMNYYRCKNILENTLKIQNDSIKLITSQSLLMLRGNKDFCEFLDIYKKKFNELEIGDKISSIIIKLGGKSNVDVFKTLVMLSLKNDKIDFHDKNSHILALEPHSSIKDDILKFSDNFGGTGDFVNQVIKIFSNIPGTDTYVSEFTKYFSKEFDLGLWVSLNALDGILYLSNSSLAIQKYKIISSYIKKISSFISLGRYTLGVVNLVGQSWLHLFSSPFITNFSSNPFSIFTSLLSIRISKSVSSNYSAIWKDICDHFEEYKKNYNHVPRTPTYDYFVIKSKCDPGEAMHKIADIFKIKLETIIEASNEINNSTIKLVEKIERYNKKKSSTSRPAAFLGIYAFNASSANATKHLEDEILTEYIKVFLSIFSQAKELEAYDQYLNFLKDFDLEVNNFLKLHFMLLGVEDKGAFSVINFGTNPDVNKKIFPNQ